MAIRHLTNSLLALTLFFVCSCGKDNDTTTPAETYLEGTNWVPSRVKQLDEHIYLDEQYNVVYVVNYPAPDVGHGASEGHRAWYFNFDTHKAVDSAAAVDGEATWHIMFNSIYNSQINVDAATAEGKNGLGKIRVVRTAFDELTAAPADSMIRNSVPISFDINDVIDSWGYYQFSDHSLVPYKDRSLIFLLKDNRYVKVELVNLYKDNPATAPDYKDENTKNLAPWFNFRYYVQETKGDLNLKTNTK